MIPLMIDADADADAPFVARLASDPPDGSLLTARRVTGDSRSAIYSGDAGLFELALPMDGNIAGDVLLVHPQRRRAERLLRHGSAHNTLLVTERCDQLCVMCSQPPKKTHEDRFALLTEACLLADPGQVIGITGGEPTLFKAQLLGMIETVLTARPDLRFHVLSNGQHFAATDIDRLRSPLYQRVEWGIPLYAAAAALHDRIVAKEGAFARLEDSLAHLLMAGANIELRTVVLSHNVDVLPNLARHVAARLGFIGVWSIMQLENIGFARNRWQELYHDHRHQFDPIAAALDIATLHGIGSRLFNFPLCTVPPAYRQFATASISDWKRRFGEACDACSAKADCSGFFEWHPAANLMEVIPL